MDSSKIKVIIVAALALLFSIYLGVSVASAQKEALGWVGGGMFLVICLALGKHIWILIPASLGLRGGLNFLPGSIEPWHIATAVVGGFFTLRILTRQQPINLRWCALDTAVLLVGLTILQAFLRNPTGLLVFGGADAGGKPYLVFGVAIVAFLLVGMADADMRSFRWAVAAFVLFSVADGCIVAISGLSQGFAGFMLPYYSNVNASAALALDYNTDTDSFRFTDLAGLGNTLGLVACTYWRPIAALDLTKPWRLIIALIGLAATVLAGYRSYMVRLVLNFVQGSMIRGKPIDSLGFIALGVMTVAVLVVAVPSGSLPYSMQRLLTLIPGYKASESVSKDAEDSIEKRVEMWRLALLTDRYISNKLLGDGFHLKSADAELISAWSRGDKQVTAVYSFQDVMMATGSYHGFHAETIRCTGIVGLIAATWLLVILALYSLGLIRFFKGHPAWGCVLFVCMPLLIEPFWVWLVYGSYKGAFYRTLAVAGWVKLLYVMSKRVPRQVPTAGGSPHNS